MRATCAAGLVAGLSLLAAACGPAPAPTPTPAPTPAPLAATDVPPASTPVPATPTPEPPPSPTPRPEGWTEIKMDPDNSPSPRSDHAMAMLPDGSILMFGGKDENGNALGDTWILSLDGQARITPHKVPGLARPLLRPLLDWNPVNPSNAPAARYGHSLLSSIGNFYLYGGTDGQQQFNDMYKYTGGDWQQIQSADGSAPPPRSFHHAWSYDDKLYVSGGMGKTAAGKDTWLEDLWRYDTGANTWEQLPNPPGFISPNAFPAVYNNRVDFLDPHVQAAFGGPSYSYDMAGGKWEQSQPQGDWPPDERSNMMWAQGGGTVYMMGGVFWDKATESFGKTAEVWSYDLPTGQWTRREDMPHPSSGGAAVHDPAMDQIIAILSGPSPLFSLEGWIGPE